MDTVAEEHPFRIGLELLELLAGAVTLVILKNILQGLPYRKIILAVLHPDDVTAIFCRFCQMVDIFLLLNGQSVPARHLIPHDLEVCKLIHKISEILLCRILPTGSHGCGKARQCNHFYNKFHITNI